MLCCEFCSDTFYSLTGCKTPTYLLTYVVQFKVGRMEGGGGAGGRGGGEDARG